MAVLTPRTDADEPSVVDRRPTAILVLAAAQGLALLALHYAAKREVWPATNLAILVPLYLNVALLPLTAQLLARFLGAARLKWTLVGMAAALTAFGWHFAANVSQQTPRDLPEHAFPNAVPLAVLWLIVVAFLRAQLETGRTAPEYRALFAAAWRNKLTLLEAFVFVGALWLLLALWAGLFRTLDIRFFSDLFSQPWFVYPATAMAAGFALHLIGSVDRIVDVVLQQVLSLFKWLAPVAGLIVVLFAVALTPQLPQLLTTGERPLNSVWLLWLVAVSVLLINAAYQDGTAPRPYGATLSLAMRFVPPLLTLIALTAAYALYVRMSTFGMTVGRFWGFVTACVGLAHAAAATVAATRAGPWLSYTSKTNPLLAATLAAVLILALTPALSPYRLSATSQQRIALAGGATQRVDGALTYLRFSAGGYGRDELQEIADRSGDATADTLAASARRVMEQQFRGYPTPTLRNFDSWRSELRVYPADRPIPPGLDAALRAAPARPILPATLPAPFALWIDVTGDPELELFLSLANHDYELYAQENGAWRMVSNGVAQQLFGWDVRARDAALAAGDFAAQPPALRDVRIGERTLRLAPLPTAVAPPQAD